MVRGRAIQQLKAPIDAMHQYRLPQSFETDPGWALGWQLTTSIRCRRESAVMPSHRCRYYAR